MKVAFESFNKSNNTVEEIEFLDGRLAYYSEKKPFRDSDNEDSTAGYILGKKHGVLLVADGMGGHRSGGDASRIAIESIKKELDSSFPKFSSRECILKGLESAHNEIKKLGVGAGSTMAIAEINENTVRFYTCGDSIAMVISGQGDIKYKNVEHSPVGYGVEAGMLTPKEALEHEESNIISFALGLSEMRIEISSTMELSPRDRILVSSDGLTANLLPKDIANFLNKESPGEKLSELVKVVRDKMIKDNEATDSADDLATILFKQG